MAGGVIGALLGGLIVFMGWTGLILGVVGSFGTLFRRLADPALRAYSSFPDYFNILLVSFFSFPPLSHACWLIRCLSAQRLTSSAC